MMSNVSIIVPIYNVAPYLKKCIDSIVNQTLKNIEVILIDDGSSDGSGGICDEYAKGDCRIRVIHKDHCGLSCARNSGIDVATASFIMFVDGDDWVDSRFCEIAYNTAKKYDADMVIFQACSVKNGNIRCKEKRNIPMGIVDAETAVIYGGNAAWNKLYSRGLFSSIRYPEDRVYEDLATTHRLVFLAKKIVMIPDRLYYWMIRGDSITHSISRKNIEDSFVSALQKYEDLSSYGCSEAVYTPMLISYSIGYLARVYPTDDMLYLRAKEAVDVINYIPSSLSWKKKILLILWKINPSIFHIICRMFGEKVL